MEQTAGYTIKIQNFEGPLDLLFHLIEKSKMDIYDIRITEIADQYIDYLSKMEELDLEITSEFLVMASTLLLIKSKMLLPESNKAGEEQEELKDDLVSRLIEYKRYKEFTKELKDREAYFVQIFYKPHEIFKVHLVQIVNRDYPRELIPALYQGICERNVRKTNIGGTSIEDLIIKEKVTIRSMIRDVLKQLVIKGKFGFSELFNSEKNTRLEIATSFMALLELAKVKRVTLEQKKSFGEIWVNKVKKNNSHLDIEASFGENEEYKQGS